MTKRVLFVLSGIWSTGGIEKYNQNLLRGSIEAGYSSEVISRNDERKEFNDMHVYSFGHIRNILYRKAAFSLMTLLRAYAFKPDVIVCGHIHLSPLCYIVSLLLKTKYLVLTHGIDVWNIAGKLQARCLRKAALVTTVSEFTRNIILEQLPDIKDKIELLPNTVDVSQFSPGPRPDYLMERHKIEKQNKVILTVARLKKTEVRKGHYKVLEVMADLVKTFPEIRYVLVGSGDDLDNIRTYLRTNNLEESVILAGHVPERELPDYYNLSDVFVMPSSKEGFGIVFLEAIASGKPVICGNKDGSVEAVLNGEAGILVDPDSTEEIKQAVINVLQKINDKRSGGDRFRERIIEEFGNKRFQERIVKCLEAL